MSPTYKENSKILPPLNARTKDYSSDLNDPYPGNHPQSSSNSTSSNTRRRSSSASNSSSFLRYSFEGLSSYSESNRQKKLDKLCVKKLMADLHMLAGHLDEAMAT